MWGVLGFVAAMIGLWVFLGIFEAVYRWLFEG